ncbi:MAG: protein-glutamate O-methyltransferase CheR [Pedobacter sp.]|nr:protein-glutamate O-methyltransferase CheR [Pedobacter sp.]MDQ8054576.1 protein-glutamate O-methyltransferase CheR [Pedobacter sp.]
MKNAVQAAAELNDKQLQQLIDLIRHLHGFDFSDYAQASLKRRVSRVMQLKRISFPELSSQLINDPHYFDYFLSQLTVNTTEMFRDPSFFKVLKEKVIPYLNSYQHIKVWSSGCSSGEELYSLAILFKEAGLYARSFFYGTDINQEVLQKAKDGIYDLARMKQYSENFIESDSQTSLSNYYTAKYDAASISRKLKKNVLFSTHNLVSDGPFNEFQLIACRNVLIYFNTQLQSRAIELFYNSLANFGFLCLGTKETIRDPEVAKKFKLIDKKHNIYQKVN